MPLPRRLTLLVLVMAATIGLDQFTKVLANTYLKGKPTETYLGDMFRLQYATNDGAFLSLGSNLPDWARFWVLTVGVGALLLGIVIYVARTAILDAWHVTAYALIAGGGIANWVDRARFGGSVVDFMNMGIGPVRTGVFNVADVGIMVGIGLIFVVGWVQDRAKAKAAAATPPANPPSAPAN